MEGHCDSITSLSRFSLSLTLSVIVISLSSQLCTQRYNSSECLSPLSLSLSFLPLFRIPYPSSSSASSACTSTIKQQAAAGFSREFVSLNHWMRLRAFDTPKTTTPTPTTTTTTMSEVTFRDFLRPFSGESFSASALSACQRRFVVVACSTKSRHLFKKRWEIN